MYLSILCTTKHSQFKWIFVHKNEHIIDRLRDSYICQCVYLISFCCICFGKYAIRQARRGLLEKYRTNVSKQRWKNIKQIDNFPYGSTGYDWNRDLCVVHRVQINRRVYTLPISYLTKIFLISQNLCNIYRRRIVKGVGAGARRSKMKSRTVLGNRMKSH